MSGARKMLIIVISAPPRMQHVISVANKDTSNEKKGQDKDKKSKYQCAVDMLEDNSNEQKDDFDLKGTSINALDNRKSREVFALVAFDLKGDSSPTHEVTGKVDIGVMVSCVVTSMLPKIGPTTTQRRSPWDVRSRSSEL